MSTNEPLPGDNDKGNDQVPQFSSGNIKKRDDAEMFTQVSDRIANERKNAQIEARRKQDLEKTRKDFQDSIAKQKKLVEKAKVEEAKEAKRQAKREKFHASIFYKFFVKGKRKFVWSGVVIVLIAGSIVAYNIIKPIVDEENRKKEEAARMEREAEASLAVRGQDKKDRLKDKYGDELYSEYEQMIDEAETDELRLSLANEYASRLLKDNNAERAASILTKYEKYAISDSQKTEIYSSLIIIYKAIGDETNVKKYNDLLDEVFPDVEPGSVDYTNE